MCGCCCSNVSYCSFFCVWIFSVVVTGSSRRGILECSICLEGFHTKCFLYFFQPCLFDILQCLPVNFQFSTTFPCAAFFVMNIIRCPLDLWWSFVFLFWFNINLSFQFCFVILNDGIFWVYCGRSVSSLVMLLNLCWFWVSLYYNFSSTCGSRKPIKTSTLDTSAFKKSAYSADDVASRVGFFVDLRQPQVDKKERNKSPGVWSWPCGARQLG